MDITIREMGKLDSAKCQELTVQLGYPDGTVDFDKRFSLNLIMSNTFCKSGELLFSLIIESLLA